MYRGQFVYSIGEVASSSLVSLESSESVGLFYSDDETKSTDGVVPFLSWLLFTRPRVFAIHSYYFFIVSEILVSVIPVCSIVTWIPADHLVTVFVFKSQLHKTSPMLIKRAADFSHRPKV